MYLLAAALVALVCACAYFLVTWNHDYWSKRGVPCKEPQWLFGNYKDILFLARHMGIFFEDLYKAYPEAAYVGYLRMSQPGIMLRDPELIRTILTSDFSSFANNDIKIDREVDKLFGLNPFVLTGEEWKTSRNHFIPAISGTRLKTYFPDILPICNRMNNYIKQNIGDNRVALLETKTLSGKFTTDVIANAVFGVENDSFTNEDSVFHKLTSQFFDGSAINNLKILVVLLFPRLARIVRARFVSKETEVVLLKLTRSVLKHRSETGESRNDFFQQMITNRQNDKLGVFTDSYIAAHCFGFLGDGYETSSDVLCFTLFELAWHDGVQERLRQEIAAMLKETGGELSYERVVGLEYLDWVMSESLRMHPPAILMTRVCTAKGYRLPPPESALGGGVELAEGTPVTIPVYALHTDPQHFPEPQLFDPDRFAPDRVAGRHKYAYLPFGEGPRICLGIRFAQMQVKLALIAILRQFRLKPSAKSAYPVLIDPQMFLKRPLNGAWVCFQEL